MPTLGYFVGPVMSNAPHISDLGGDFGELGGGGEIGTVTAGGDVSTGLDAENRQIVVLNGDLGQSLDLPFVLAGFEIHGLVTDTGTLATPEFHF
jgi:hypothetical protein